jgi:hypothetical protein
MVRLGIDIEERKNENGTSIFTRLDDDMIYTRRICIDIVCDYTRKDHDGQFDLLAEELERRLVNYSSDHFGEVFRTTNLDGSALLEWNLKSMFKELDDGD